MPRKTNAIRDYRRHRKSAGHRERNWRPHSLVPPEGLRRWPMEKMKGIATIRLPNGVLRVVELHWYEAHGIGKRDLKIKRYVSEA